MARSRRSEQSARNCAVARRWRRGAVGQPRAGEGLPCSRRHLPHVPRPLRQEVLRGCFQVLHPFHGLRPEGLGSVPPLPRATAGTLTTRQASLHAADRVVAPPARAFDIGLRPGPFPVRAADLLPGLLVVTRTGLAPAGDDEHASRLVRSSRTVLRLQGALAQGGVLG